MLNPKQTTADILGLDVTYLGTNGVKQHLFGNGSPIASHVFTTLEEAVERFGKRIKVEPKHYVQSVNFKQGYASNSYAPRPNADRVERIEYGMGYLKRLIEKAQTANVVAPKVDMRLPHEVFQDQAKAAYRGQSGGQPSTERQLIRDKEVPRPVSPEPKAEIADRLAASRAALMNPVLTPPAEDMEIGDAPPEPVAHAPKKRGPKPKVQP